MVKRRRDNTPGSISAERMLVAVSDLWSMGRDYFNKRRYGPPKMAALSDTYDGEELREMAKQLWLNEPGLGAAFLGYWRPEHPGQQPFAWREWGKPCDYVGILPDTEDVATRMTLRRMMWFAAGLIMPADRVAVDQ